MNTSRARKPRPKAGGKWLFVPEKVEANSPEVAALKTHLLPSMSSTTTSQEKTRSPMAENGCW
jgi:hypothetical protein